MSLEMGPELWGLDEGLTEIGLMMIVMMMKMMVRDFQVRRNWVQILALIWTTRNRDYCCRDCLGLGLGLEMNVKKVRDCVLESQTKWVVGGGREVVVVVKEAAVGGWRWSQNCGSRKERLTRSVNHTLHLHHLKIAYSHCFQNPFATKKVK